MAESNAHMTEATNDSFAQIVEWAYSTLPQQIRELRDFPGIQIAEEPPVDVLKRIREERNWPKERELLGLYSGLHRNEPQHFQSRIAPDLIFVFQGPIARCSRGNLPAEVKQVVWHEVAHWLGHNEVEVKELGLSRAFEEIARDPLKGEALQTGATERFADTPNRQSEAEQQPRCISCYSADVACRDVRKPLSYVGANSFDPVTVHAKSYKCKSCGCVWVDEDSN
jgi:predicted Zn-dependent protease with MMP-like domain